MLLASALLIAHFAKFHYAITSVQQVQYGGGWGIYGPYGRPPPGAYDLPGCNPYYNPECGRFRWEGPRARRWRWENHPMMPDNPYRPYPPPPPPDW